MGKVAQLWVSTALLLATVFSGAAAADDVAGSEQANRGSGTQFAWWLSNVLPDKVDAYVDTNSLGSGKCQDVFFDWRSSLDHWDSRVVRNCYPNSRRETDQNGNGWYLEHWVNQNNTLTANQKAAGCIYYINRTSYTDSSGNLDCGQFSQDNDDVAERHAYPANAETMEYRFVQFWVRRENGNRDFISGGLPFEPEN